ncbi:MAG: glycosyltransferase [Euzebya sp.]
MATTLPSTSPSPTLPSSSAPRVLAILVAHNGAEWITSALRTLSAQAYPRLGILAVDNASTDDTAAILSRRGVEVIRQERNGGFGRAVAAAMRSVAAADADYVLLVHDDMALMPDAVQWLVDALESDQTLSVVGPKLREWNEEALLQQVGMSADSFGRAEPQVDRGELDQGQHDDRGDCLYVSTAGMMLRRDVFGRTGGFDGRFSAFRDDLDLCWRVWLSGRRVAVVTNAIGYHVGAAAGGLRGQLDQTESRYRVERHTMAALLKNYSGRRLAWVLPLGFVLNGARFIALLLSRRFGEAFAIIRAYLWNLAQLGGTLRRRSAVQSTRRQPDSSLSALFTPGLPRVQEYTNSLLEIVAGGTNRALVDADDIAVTGIDPLAGQPIQRFLRDRSLVLLGIPLLLAFLASLGGYLGGGPIVGGEIAAWPDSPAAFLQNYLSPWGGQPLASASFPSPVQAVLGVLSTLLGGSAWLAQRVLVFGLIPLAFVTTLRAGRLVTSRPWPRVVGAAVYVMSPVVLGMLAQGRYGLAVLAGLLPAVVSLTIRTVDPGTAPGVAWRSAALLSLTVVLTLGSAPLEAMLVPGILAVAALVALVRGWIRPLTRVLVAGLSGVVMLGPWLFDLLRDGGPEAGTLATAGGPAAIVDLPVWRALLGQPQTVDGLSGVLGLGMVCVPVAILLGALVVGMRARPLITGTLVLLFVASGAAAWAAAFYRLPLLYPPALLLPGAVALAVLGIIVARWSTQTLTSADFGIGQVFTAVAGIVLVVGLLAGMGVLISGPYSGLSQDPELVPAFIGAESGDLGTYRVLLLQRAPDGTVRWELTDDDGPRMTAFGTLRDKGLTDLITTTLTQIVQGVGSSAAAPLGVLNIRYVVLQQPDATLQTALSQQVDLEPSSSQAAVTYRLRTWLPRASVIPEPFASRLLATGDPGPTDSLGVGALQQQQPGAYSGGQDGPTSGLLVISEASSTAWRTVATTGSAGTVELAQVDLAPVNAFRVEGDQTPLAQTSFQVVAGGGFRRRLVVALQLLVALGVISLAVRPPGARITRPRATSLPQDLIGLADTTTTFTRIDPAAPPPRDRS